VSTVSGGIFRYSPPVAAATAVPQPVSTSAPIAARVAPPVIPLHALSLTLRRVEAGRSCDDTLMHNVGDQHWCTDCRTHTQSSVLVHPSVLRFTRALGHRNGVLKT
jgi:hypothetical protein